MDIHSIFLKSYRIKVCCNLDSRSGQKQKGRRFWPEKKNVEDENVKKWKPFLSRLSGDQFKNLTRQKQFPLAHGDGASTKSGPVIGWYLHNWFEAWNFIIPLWHGIVSAFDAMVKKLANSKQQLGGNKIMWKEKRLQSF